MDRIIETYDISLRGGDRPDRPRKSDKECINILRTLDALGITYIDIGTPARGEDSRAGFYKAVRELKLQTSILVPFLRVMECDASIGSDEVVGKILSLETEAVCLEGECSEHILRTVSGIRPDENLWRISSLISWFRSRGKTVIFNAGNFFDALEASSTYAREVIRTAMQAGADRIVISDNNGYALVHDVIAAMDVLDGLRVKRIGVCLGNASGCAEAGAIAAARNGAMHIQGSFLGTDVVGGTTSLATTIVNLQLSMGYRCIQDSKLNRITQTAEYIAELTNSIVPSHAPFVGRDAFSRDLVVVPRARAERISPELVGNSRRVNVFTTAGINTLIERLRSLGYKVGKEQILRLKCVQNLEQDGYVPEVTMLLRVLREMGKLDGLYTVHSLQVTEDLLLDLGHQRSTVLLETTVGGEHNLDVAQEVGLHTAIAKALVGAVGRKFPSVRGVRINNIRGRFNADVGTHTLFCDVTNGERSWNLVTTGSNLTRCIFEAARDSVDLHLLLQGYYKEI